MDNKNTPTATSAAPVEHQSKLSFDDRVLKKIAGIATDDVDGVVTVSSGFVGGVVDRFRSADAIKGVDAEVGEKQVAIDLNVVCEFGKHIPGIFNEVHNRVQKAVREMTGLDLIELNMHVEDILRKSDMDELRQHQAAGLFGSSNKQDGASASH
ncbi:MAG: Asp23/Gls24 family envelope stress response protein [Ruminococcaceae bacterium]|nr:Asp23/Gls24 family envelope stress response protein [Oscillospiraceae bacterium]